MYNLLIVDDEQEILDYLRSLFIEMKDPEFSIYTAQSGEEAIDWLNKVKVDIVLSDIMMPGINGIELLDRIKYNWPSCKVIFLTGHREFELIYAATRYVDIVYLLKTVESSEIVNRVRTASETIQSKIQQEELLEKAARHLEQVLPMIRQETLARILCGFAEKEEVSQSVFNELGLSLDINLPIHIVVGRFDDFNKPIYFHRIQELFSIKLITRQYLPDYINFEIVPIDDTYLVWIVQHDLPVRLIAPNTDDENHKTVIILGAFESIQAACGHSLQKSLSLAACAKAVYLQDVENVFRELRKLINRKYGRGSQMFLLNLDEQAGLERENEMSERLPQGIAVHKINIREMGILIETGQKKQYFTTLKPVLQYLSQSDIKNSSTVQEIYLQISIQLLNYINRYNLIDKLAVIESITQLGNVTEFTTGEEAARYITHISDTIFGLQENMQKERSIDSISVIRQYVENHTTQDLSLVKLAGLVSFNPAYLSRLFKQTTGENLSDYVMREKLKKALYLLDNTELSIKEVSAQMGFYTPTYFAKFFKRLAGVSPQKYRQSRMKSSVLVDQFGNSRSNHE